MVRVDPDFGLWRAEREGELTGKRVDLVAASITIMLTNAEIYKIAERLTKEPPRVSCNSAPVSRNFCSSPCNQFKI
jgi:hypothetical protein